MKFQDIENLLISEGYLSDLPLSRICLSLIVTLIISFWIFFTYKARAQNEFYSKNFNISLALMPIITDSIILAMQSNLVISLGMVGALSIVRYRTAIKNSLDLFFMFWAISIGIICGAGQYFLAILMSLLVSFLLLTLQRMNFLNAINVGIVRCRKASDLDVLEKDLKKICTHLKIKSKQVNLEFNEIIFEYKLRKKVNLTAFLSNRDDVEDFQIVSNN